MVSVVDPDTGASLPVNLGHEFCGTLRSVPKGSNLKVGQAVMIDPHCICRKCITCRSGNDQSCAELSFLGYKHSHFGGLAEYATVEERHCLPLPDNVSLDFAAVIEPLVVCQHAAKVAGVILEGLNVLIVGGGPIGSALVPILQAHKVGKIFLSEPTMRRREQYKAVVDRVIEPRSENVGEVCRDLTNGRGVDIAFDCAGVQSGLDAAFDALKHAGIYVNVAVWEKPVCSVRPPKATSFSDSLWQIQLHFATFFFKEINVKTSCCYNETDFQETMKLLGDGKQDQPVVNAFVELTVLVQVQFVVTKRW
jgi:threonine dehydrogenase-like Zn-dependent dehydrogenase